MLSRAACAPRICQACRLSLAQRSAVVGFRTLRPTDRTRLRLYSSNRLDKVKIEAIISGEMSSEAAEKFFKRQKRLQEKEKRRLTDDDLPDWGLRGPQTDREELQAIEDALSEVSKAPNPSIDRAGPESLEDASSKETKISKSQTDQAESRSIEDALSEETTTSKWPIFAQGLEEDVEYSSISNLGIDAKNETPAHANFASKPTEPDFDSIFDLDGALGKPRQSPDAESHQRRRTSFENGFELPSDLLVPEAPAKRFHDELLHDATLNISALGKPASAIIIKNPNKLRRRRRAATVLEEQSLDANMRLDWERFMSREDNDGVASSEEAFENIEELRPQDTNILRMNEFNKIAHALCAGFTTIQLRDYYRDSNTGLVAEDKGVIEYSWITKQIAWTPVNTLPSESQTLKQTYAQRILSLKWKIEIQDYVDDLGRAYLWVDPEFFPLITQGSRSTVDALREEFLIEANHERMTTTSAECRINITARKPSSYAILDRLDEAFKRLQRKRVSVGQFTNPSEAELQELARITNTYIKLIKSGKDAEIEVSWISESPATETLPAHERNESPADIVFRLLTLRHNRGLTNTLVSSTEVTGQFVDFHREAKSMAWRDKLQTWSRRMEPVNKDSESQQTCAKVSDFISLPEAAAGKYGGTQLITTATFGHILHSDPNATLSKLNKNRRILCPVIPHPAAFSALTPDSDSPLTQETAIILNFAPRADRAAGLDGKGPSIRLRLPVNDDANLSDFTLPKDATFKAIVPSHVSDVLMPDQSVDIRLSHQRFFPLDINQTPLKEFLDVSEFNLLAGKLKTPSQVTFSIPEKMLDPKYMGKLKSTTNIDVPYMFCGLEIHQTVEIPWREHTLRYSSIEAGQHGGQRQELTLQAGLPGKTTAFKGEKRASFIQCAADLATGNVFSWDEGYKAMKERQFEDHSFNLPAEELGEDFLVSEFEEDEMDEGDISSMRRSNDHIVIRNGEIMDEELDDIFNDDDGDDGMTERERMQLEQDMDELLNLDDYERTFKIEANDGEEASVKLKEENIEGEEANLRASIRKLLGYVDEKDVDAKDVDTGLQTGDEEFDDLFRGPIMKEKDDNSTRPQSEEASESIAAAIATLDSRLSSMPSAQENEQTGTEKQDSSSHKVQSSEPESATTLLISEEEQRIAEEFETSEIISSRTEPATTPATSEDQHSSPQTTDSATQKAVSTPESESSEDNTSKDTTLTQQETSKNEDATSVEKENHNDDATSTEKETPKSEESTKDETSTKDTKKEEVVEEKKWWMM